MKIKLNEIVSASSGIPANEKLGIAEQKSSLGILLETKFPAKVSYRIKRLVDKLEPILKTYNEKRNELIKELGEVENDNFSIKDPEKLKEFVSKLNEILEVEEEVEFEQIKIAELENVNVAAKDLVSFVFE